MKYPLVFYVESLSGTKAGEARGPVVRILESKRDDPGILAHEMVHVRQWFRTLGIHSFLYLLSDDYKLRAEVEAYREQALHCPDDRRPLFAKFLSERYDLSITPEAALELLK